MNRGCAAHEACTRREGEGMAGARPGNRKCDAVSLHAPSWRGRPEVPSEKVSRPLRWRKGAA